MFVVLKKTRRKCGITHRAVVLQSKRKGGKSYHVYLATVGTIKDHNLKNRRSRASFWIRVLRRLELLGPSKKEVVIMKKKINAIVPRPRRLEQYKKP